MLRRGSDWGCPHGGVTTEIHRRVILLSLVLALGGRGSLSDEFVYCASLPSPVVEERFLGSFEVLFTVVRVVLSWWCDGWLVSWCLGVFVLLCPHVTACTRVSGCGSVRGPLMVT